ncbi:MAG: hypothetical protein Q4A29_09935 [Eubacteriales bacterium]|nr:hypothetical protein [Eubacteriales bacterium]
MGVVSALTSYWVFIRGHSGLGLYFTKQLVEQLQGTVEIKNGSHGGACVTFRHPNYGIDDDSEKSN